MFFMSQGARRCDYEARSSRMSSKQANEVKQGQKRSKELPRKDRLESQFWGGGGTGGLFG